MGRKRILDEDADKTIIRLEPGTLDRVAAALAPKESKAHFFRTAVEAELQRRDK